MNNKHFELPPNRLRRGGVRLMQAAALALMAALAMPAGAADARAIKTRIPPVYPVVAQRMRITGVVHLTVTVDAEGKVTDVKTINGNRALSTAAEEAVRQWRFDPGDSITTVDVTVTFAL
jgi:TonB family protein